MSAVTIGSLLRHGWARHRLPLLPIAVVIGLFEFIMTRTAPAPNEVSWMTGILSALPPGVRALVGNEIAMSPGGFLAIGYAHPFFMLLLATWIVRVSSAALAGEIGLGTMDLLASRPVPRWHFVAAGMVTIAVGLIVILTFAWSGTAIGLRLRPLGVHPSAFAPVAAGAWLLFATWGAIGLLVAATRRDGGQAIAWTTAIVAASFVLDYLARLWTPIHRLRPMSLFRYYEPQAIFAAGLPAKTLTVLAATAVVSLIASVIVFSRRDL